MRFQVITTQKSKYKVLDTLTEKFCAYSGKAFMPPRYEGESKCKYSEWNNWHCAYDFAQRLEFINQGAV